MTHTSLRLLSPLLVSSFSLLVAASLAAGCTEVAPDQPDGGPRSIDAFVERDGSEERPDASDGGRRDGAGPDGAPTDAPLRDAGTDAPIGCGPDCPRGFCIGGVCTVMPSCCYTGYCAGGLRCDDSCTCVPPTGCCAGEACASGEICEEYSCECVREDDCCRVIGCDVGEICNSDCSCAIDTSCGPECSGDRFCWYSECRARCEFEGCLDPSLVCDLETGACVPPRCTPEECAFAGEPPLSCDPGRGCYDACAEGDWEWCTAMGGRCVLGTCVDDSCSALGVGCHYRYDCCGNAVCQRDDEPDPICYPETCGPMPYSPPRPDLCSCSSYGYCQDAWGGFRGRFPPDGGDGGFPLPAPFPE